MMSPVESRGVLPGLFASPPALLPAPFAPAPAALSVTPSCRAGPATDLASPSLLLVPESPPALQPASASAAASNVAASTWTGLTERGVRMWSYPRGLW